MSCFFIHVEAEVAHTLRILRKCLERIATAEGICSSGCCSYLTRSMDIYTLGRDGGGHIIIGRVLVPYEFHGNLHKGQRWQRAYAHRDGAHTLSIPWKFIECGLRRQRAYAHRNAAHTLRIPRKYREWTTTVEGICSPGRCSNLTNSIDICRMDCHGTGHMLTGMVLVPYEFNGNLWNRLRRRRAYAHRDGAYTLRVPNQR